MLEILASMPEEVQQAMEKVKNEGTRTNKRIRS